MSASVMIHAEAKESQCTRDILVSASMTLYQLQKFILIAFGIHESSVEFQQFILHHDMLETCFQIIDATEIDGFVTPVAPGVYIEHTHPHEPLPLFSLYCSTIHDHNTTKMTLRTLRDQRYCTLGSLPSTELFFEMQYNRHHYCIRLDLKTVNLPIHFAQEIDLNPKIVNRKGNDLSDTKIMLHYFIPVQKNHYPSDEQWIKNACQQSMEKLILERENFLISHGKKCEWIEPTGEKCVYCTLSSSLSSSKK